MRKLLLVVAVLVGLVFGVSIIPTASLVYASQFQFEYSGTLRYIFNGHLDNGEDLGFAEGQTISGSFVFDNSTPDNYSSSDRAFYPNGVSSFTFGGISSASSTTTYSYFSVSAITCSSIDSYLNEVSGNISDVFQFGLLASGNPLLIGDDQVNLTTLDLNSFDGWDNSGFSFQRAIFQPGGLPTQLSRFYVDLQALQVSIIPSPVPLPAAFWLLGSGFIGLVGMKSWKKS